ncbi:DUF4767 domain-containing protein [Lactiplantibacillus paraplantarum]|uniref:DUF4767 domain-containing protein n=1 Tax=Lactiplantibacillus paraplantarum TaxID=60520 RepID=UPI003557FA9D
MYRAHLYLFTIHKGVPNILIIEQNQKNKENKVYFKNTENSKLKAGFRKIIDGQKAASSAPMSINGTSFSKHSF